MPRRPQAGAASSYSFVECAAAKPPHTPHLKDPDSPAHIPAWVTPPGSIIHPHMHPVGRYSEPPTVAMLWSLARSTDLIGPVGYITRPLCRTNTRRSP